MIKAFLDGIEIDRVEIDFSFVEKLDMELDEAFIVLSHTPRKDPYPMFSIVDLYEDDKLLFSGRISQDNVSIVSYNDLHYNHSITLIEHTKLLEKFLITGKSFTQPTDETTVPFYTLYDVVETLRTTANFEIVGQQQLYAPFTIGENLQDELDAIIAPEFNFKDVTLRQALNEVFFYLNGIVRMKRSGEIVVERFNDLKEEITFVAENYKRDQNITSYATMMSSDVLNSVNTKLGFAEYNSEWYPGKGLWTTLRSPSLTQFNFEQSFIPTPKPIYKLENVITQVSVILTEDASSIGGGITEKVNETEYEVDIARSIVEKNIYDALEETGTNILGNVKRNTLYYEYAKKNIFIGATFGVFDIATAYYQAVLKAVTLQLADEGEIPQSYIEYLESDSQTVPDVIYNVTLDFKGNENLFERWNEIFRVNYTPITPSIRYEVARDDVSEVLVDSKSVANQKLRIVDLERFTNNMKGRINQLGNSELILSHKVKTIDNSFNIGDFTDEKFVITKKEVIGQRDHYIINYELNKNFNKMSQFMGIDQEIRQYEIGEAGRSIDRDLNYNEYIEVYSTTSAVGITNDSTISNINLFFDTFNNSYNGLGDVKYGVFTSPQLIDDNEDQIPIVLPLYKISGGNAFGFYTDFESNVSAGDSLLLGDSINFLNFDAERRYNVPFRYTNQIGRLDTMLVSLHNNLVFPESTFDQEAEIGNAFPEFLKPYSNQVVSGNFYVKKDNLERLKLTLLYHVLPKDVNDVVIGEKLVTHNGYFIDEANTLKLVTFNDDGLFTNRDKNSKFSNSVTLNLTIDTNNQYIQVNNDLSNVTRYAIVDEQGYPYIMVNGNNPRIVFNFLNKRSNVNYRYFDFIHTEEPLLDEFTFDDEMYVYKKQIEKSGGLSNEISFDDDVNISFFEFQFETSGELTDILIFDDDIYTSFVKFKFVNLSFSDVLTFNDNVSFSNLEFQFEQDSFNDSLTFSDDIDTDFVKFQFETSPPLTDSFTFSDSVLGQKNNITYTKPQLSITSIGLTTATISVSQNNGLSLRAYYRLNNNDVRYDIDPYITVLGDGTPNNINLSNLTAGTSYTLYVQLYSTFGENNSGVEPESFTTSSPDRTISPDVLSVVPSQNSVSFVLNNNDSSTAIIYFGVGTTETYSGSREVAGRGLSPTITVSGLSPGTDYNIYAEAQASGELRSIEEDPTPFTTTQNTYTISGLLDLIDDDSQSVPILSVTVTATSATYNETSQTSINDLSYTTIDDSVPEETYSVQLNTVQSFVFNNKTWNFFDYVVNGVSYGGLNNRNIIVSGINQDTQIIYRYSSFGGF